MLQIFSMATTNTMIQLVVPDPVRGRLVSIYALDRGFLPVQSRSAGGAGVGELNGRIPIIPALLIAWRAPGVRDLGVSSESGLIDLAGA